MHLGEAVKLPQFLKDENGFGNALAWEANVAGLVLVAGVLSEGLSTAIDEDGGRDCGNLLLDFMDSAILRGRGIGNT
jgi:hypothetical protein